MSDLFLASDLSIAELINILVDVLISLNADPSIEYPDLSHLRDVPDPYHLTSDQLDQWLQQHPGKTITASCFCFLQQAVFSSGMQLVSNSTDVDIESFTRTLKQFLWSRSEGLLINAELNQMRDQLSQMREQLDAATKERDAAAKERDAAAKERASLGKRLSYVRSSHQKYKEEQLSVFNQLKRDHTTSHDMLKRRYRKLRSQLSTLVGDLSDDDLSEDSK
eukprot:gnl/Dysnectes_brevis/6356_a9810_490.p1 GENE.gnl/Dysnectes_brevis/6356_a9810_490~~gnl/Dysnectes_brevis/6356_a9810_490.p1  ORF type:complete len:245 (-),score=8.26 gnl/Dysnectes_brevis/6356_a9810_490:45-707(-)